MNRLLLLPLVFLGGCMARAATDTNRIVGHWTVTAFESPGAVQERSQLHKKADVTEGTWSQQFDGERFEDFEYSLDPSKSPKEIDLHYTQPDGVRVTVRGIYELNGDQMRLCLGSPPVKRRGDRNEKVESVRAVAFEAKDGVLISFRRVWK